jgi:thiol-disulfide isomerase/thioredoxin
LNKYYSKRDSVHKYFQNLALKTSVQDKYLKIFFEAEKAENEFDRASRILSFIENRHYKTKEAERIFVGYIAPSRILDQKINLYSPRSRSFFRTYLVDYFMARKRETDTVTVRKIGHYAMVLDYMAKNYTATSKSYSILSTLLFLTEGVRSYPAHLPPIDSLIRIYEQHISPQDRKLIWNTYRKNKAMLSAIYAEGQKIDVFNIEDGNGKQIELKSKLSEVTVIDLWASWCTNCIEAFPVGDSLEKEYKDNKRVSFVRLSLDDKKETWQKSVKRLNIDLGNSFWIEGGMKSIFAKKFDVHYLPSWLVVAKNGQVLKMYMPHIAERNRFKAAIDKFLVLK